MSIVKISQKFDWDTDDLLSYIDENIDELSTRLIEQARSVRLMKIKQGIKGTQSLNDIDTDINWQSGAACGFNPNGSAVFGRKSLTVVDIKDEKEFCNKDLIGVWPQTKLKAGAENELRTLPFEQAILDLMLAKNALAVDKAIWIGDTTSPVNNLNKFNGIIKQMLADADVINLNTTSPQASITNSNALDVFKNAYDDAGAANEALVTDKRFAFGAGWNTIQKLVRNIGDDDFYHYKVEEIIDGKRELIAVEIPGTMTKVYHLPGLDGTSYIVAGLFGSDGGFVVGTDTEGDWTKIHSGYEERLQSLWYRMQFRLGATYVFSEEVGLWTPTGS